MLQFTRRMENADMSDDTKTDVDQLLGLLAKWRHLPAYRLESRADVFFAPFMRDVVQKRVQKTLHKTIIPEFPLRCGTLFGEDIDSPNSSKKVDYMLFSEDARSVYLVELKTDQSSRRNEQDDYLIKSEEVSFYRLVEGLLVIASKTSKMYIKKYFHLLWTLERLGFVRIPDAVYDCVFPVIRRGWSEKIRDIENLVDDSKVKIQVLYVQPCVTTENTIGFEEFARAIVSKGSLGKSFAKALGEWVDTAGDVDPREGGMPPK